MSFNAKELEFYLGRGLTLPLKLENGKAPVETGFDLIRSSIRMILAWFYGTRFFLNEFGSRIENLEEPNDDVLSDLVETLTEDAINEWEKRVEIISVTTERDKNIGDTLNIRVTYRIKTTEKEDTFIYPFYSQITS